MTSSQYIQRRYKWVRTQKPTVKDLNRASSKSQLDRLYKNYPELYEEGAEYSRGMHPDELKTATKKWAKVLGKKKFNVEKQLEKEEFNWSMAVERGRVKKGKPFHHLLTYATCCAII